MGHAKNSFHVEFHISSRLERLPIVKFNSSHRQGLANIQLILEFVGRLGLWDDDSSQIPQIAQKFEQRGAFRLCREQRRALLALRA